MNEDDPEDRSIDEKVVRRGIGMLFNSIANLIEHEGLTWAELQVCIRAADIFNNNDPITNFVSDQDRQDMDNLAEKILKEVKGLDEPEEPPTLVN